MSVLTTPVPDWLADRLKRANADGEEVYDWSLVAFCGGHKPSGWDRTDPDDREPIALVAWLMNPEERRRVDARDAEWKARSTDGD